MDGVHRVLGFVLFFAFAVPITFFMAFYIATFIYVTLLSGGLLETYVAIGLILFFGWLFTSQ